jgi:hypothetical protein
MDKKEMQVKWKQVRKEWKKTRRQLQKQWDKLTDEDVYQIDDQIDKMVELLQKRYGHTWQDATKELENYLTDYRDRTQEAITDKLNRMNQRPRTTPWLWGLLVLGLVALGFYWQQGGTVGQQISNQWRKMNGESPKPGDQNQAHGPTYGAN